MQVTRQRCVTSWPGSLSPNLLISFAIFESFTLRGLASISSIWPVWRQGSRSSDWLMTRWPASWPSMFCLPSLPCIETSSRISRINAKDAGNPGQSCLVRSGELASWGLVIWGELRLVVFNHWDFNSVAGIAP
ncbi:hypothetical protein D3C87_1585890 [compost metagenome]